MKKVKIILQKTEDNEWWASSPDAFGFFATGESRDEVISNAVESIAIFLRCDDDEIEPEIIEQNPGLN